MQKKNLSAPTRPPLFGNLRVLCAAAMLIALSVVLGKYLAVSTPIFRFSLENLPILMAGLFFGPVIGGVVGITADLIGCAIMSYAINPFITLGAALIGILPGLISLFATRGGKPLTPVVVCLSVAAAHIVGSMTVKTIGLAIYTSTGTDKLLFRIPLYIVIGTVECVLLVLLTRNKLFMGELHRLMFRKIRRKDRKEEK